MANQKQKITFEDARKVLNALDAEGFESRFAGGCVRDRLLGLAPADFDIATTGKPFDVDSVAQKNYWKTVPTGIEHGTLTVVLPSGSCEVTTLRKDVKADGRHAVVEFDGATFEDDARRRDFTINAMFEDASGTIYDFHDGKRDLEQKILRFVGKPEERIREDYLRILRFFRFWSKFDLNPDPIALAAIPALATGLEQISQERITAEFWKVLAGPAAAAALRGMQTARILKSTLPDSEEIDHGLHLMIGDAGRRLPRELLPWTNLALIMGITNHRFWDHVAVQSLGRKMKWSDQETKTVMAIFDGWSSLGFFERKNNTAMELFDHLEQLAPSHSAQDFFAPIWYFCSEHARDSTRRNVLGWVMSIESAWGSRRNMMLPVTGRDVMEIRTDLRGSAIGDVLAYLKSSFRNNEWNTRQEGLELLRNYVHQWE